VFRPEQSKKRKVPAKKPPGEKVPRAKKVKDKEKEKSKSESGMEEVTPSIDQ
jgi:hypothetical protein